MLAAHRRDVEGATCLVSGSGNVAQHTVEKLIELGGTVVTLSDSSGYMYDPAGVDADKLAHGKELKNVRRGRIAEYADRYKEAEYFAVHEGRDCNPLWEHRADLAFPCATQNEINHRDAQHLVGGGVFLVAEGANMPTTNEGIEVLHDAGVWFGPGKATNAGGVIVSGFEMAQNSSRIRWSAVTVDKRLQKYMKRIHRTCREVASDYDTPGNYVNGANIASFVRVADAMIDQGVA